ncbi:MAG: hypothetical protein ACKOE2_03975 [Actinomycetales bacterium]
MAIPNERLQAEQGSLTALPSMGLRIGPAPELRTVNRLSCIRFGSARYSVPVAFIGHRHQGSVLWEKDGNNFASDTRGWSIVPRADPGRYRFWCRAH